MALSKFLACALASLQTATLMPAQEPPAAAQKYRLVVTRGDGDQNSVKKGRATSQAVVEVRDENDRPVAGVLLTFALPTQGAGGSFVGGTQMTTVATNSLGQASATFTPNNVAGGFSMKVSGSVQGQSLSATIAQTNLVTAAALSTTALVTIIAVAAAGAAGAGLALRGKSDPRKPDPLVATPLRLSVGSGGVTVSAPRP